MTLGPRASRTGGFARHSLSRMPALPAKVRVCLVAEASTWATGQCTLERGGRRCASISVSSAGDVFFILLGSVPLAVRGGLLTADAAGAAWRLWPLLLVGAGIGLLLRDRRAAVIGGLVVSMTFGLIGGGLLAGGWDGLSLIACGETQAGGSKVERNGALDQVARVTLDQRCGDLNVKMTDVAGWTLASNGGDGPPQVTANTTDLRISEHRTTGHRIPGNQRLAGDLGRRPAPIVDHRPDDDPERRHRAARPARGPLRDGLDDGQRR